MLSRKSTWEKIFLLNKHLFWKINWLSEIGAQVWMLNMFASTIVNDHFCLSSFQTILNVPHPWILFRKFSLEVFLLVIDFLHGLWEALIKFIFCYVKSKQRGRIWKVGLSFQWDLWKKVGRCFKQSLGLHLVVKKTQSNLL